MEVEGRFLTGILQHVTSSGNHTVSVDFVGQNWEQLRNVPVDREGEFCFALRPRSDRSVHRLLCEVKVQDNVKLVTLRSTYQVENLTLYPIELTLVDDNGRPVYSLEKIGAYYFLRLPWRSTDGAHSSRTVLRSADRGCWPQQDPDSARP